jgi:Flp pilus assembly protein CpaB
MPRPPQSTTGWVPTEWLPVPAPEERSLFEPSTPPASLLEPARPEPQAGAPAGAHGDLPGSSPASWSVREQRRSRDADLPGDTPEPMAWTVGERRRPGSRDVRLFVARHRPLLVAVAVVVLLLSLRNALAPSAAATTQVVVAARDLAAGEALDAGDLRVVDWPAHLAPPVADVVDALDAFSGRVPATAIQAGEAVTDARLLGPGLLTGQPAGTVAVPLRLADPAAAAVVAVGDRVDVIAGSAADPAFGDAGPPTADVVAYDVLVIAVPARGGDASSGGFGALTGGAADTDAAGMLVVAAERSDAVRLAGAQAGQALSVAVRAP